MVVLLTQLYRVKSDINKLHQGRTRAVNPKDKQINATAHENIFNIRTTQAHVERPHAP